MSKLLVNTVSWFGDGKIHRMNDYLSNDPYIIAKKIDCMQKYTINGMNIEGVIATWQGPLAIFQREAICELSKQCGERGMLFALLLDPWCAKIGIGDLTTNVTNALNDPSTQTMLSGPTYLPEKYVLDFNTGADLSILASKFPTLKFLKQGVGFSWPSVDMKIVNSISRNIASVNNLKGQNSNLSMKISGICKGFNDAGMPTPKGVSLNSWIGSRDYATSVWGDQPARVLDNQGGNFFFEQLAVTPLTVPYIGFISWDDYDEGTEEESTT